MGNLETSVTESEQPVIPVPEEIAEPLPPGVITGKRNRRPTKKIQDTIEGIGIGSSHTKHLTASLGQVTAKIESDPLSVAEAMRRPDAAEWYKAMEEEVSRLQERGTWEIVTPPPDANILTSKFVLRTKKNERGIPVSKKG